MPVALRDGASVRTAYRRNGRLATVATLTSFYTKLGGVDPEASRALVRRTAGRAADVFADGRPRATPRRAGYRLLVPDGDHLAASERRCAAGVSDAVRDRRSIGSAFHEPAMASHGEARTLAYPKAALLGFAHALCQEVGHHFPTLPLIFERGEVGPQPDWDAATTRAWLRRMARKVDPAKDKKSTGPKPGSA